MAPARLRRRLKPSCKRRRAIRETADTQPKAWTTPGRCEDGGGDPSDASSSTQSAAAKRLSAALSRSPRALREPAKRLGRRWRVPLRRRSVHSRLPEMQARVGESTASSAKGLFEVTCRASGLVRPQRATDVVRISRKARRGSAQSPRFRASSLTLLRSIHEEGVEPGSAESTAWRSFAVAARNLAPISPGVPVGARSHRATSVTSKGLAPGDRYRDGEPERLRQAGARGARARHELFSSFFAPAGSA